MVEAIFLDNTRCGFRVASDLSSLSDSVVGVATVFFSGAAGPRVLGSEAVLEFVLLRRRRTAPFGLGCNIPGHRLLAADGVRGLAPGQSVEWHKKRCRSTRMFK